MVNLKQVTRRHRRSLTPNAEKQLLSIKVLQQSGRAKHGLDRDTKTPVVRIPVCQGHAARRRRSEEAISTMVSFGGETTPDRSQYPM
jgi:hypothetical protein